MYWADKLLKERTGKEIINDSWTPSGSVHMGSLKGPVIHDVLFKILKERGTRVKFMYGFDDADPIDGLPPDLQKSHGKYLGMPIYLAPSPDGKGTFGDYFSNKMKALLDKLGIAADLYKTNEIYKNGKFNEAIIFVLDHASEIRNVYERIYKKGISKDWYPLQVICPTCGKLGTTKVSSWDGKEVTFSCEPKLVEWAQGCGAKGKINPLNGIGKMPWKVEWAAKWWTFGVTIEGAGKDHASAGGSYDVALQLAESVFKIKRPLQFGYEFFLVDGRKMSSSKGIGLTGEELLEVVEPRAARFLMIHREPNQAVEFNPYSKDVIPRLYDDYQQTEVNGSNHHRAFLLSQIGEIEQVPKITFRTLTQWVQMPNMEDEIKKEGAGVWAKYARVWVEKYAPETERFLIQEKVPEEMKNLSDLQKSYLKKLSDIISERLGAEELQTKIYEISKEMRLASKDAFAAIYIALLGKDHGPKAAWLISSLDRDFVVSRFLNLR